jgi:hypothetical protein
LKGVHKDIYTDNMEILQAYFPSLIKVDALINGRSQWPQGLRHEPSSPTQTLGSWVRIPLGAWMYIYAFICVYVVLCVGSDLATG